MDEPTEDCRDEDDDRDTYSADQEEEMDEEEELPDFEMEAAGGSGMAPYKLPARIFNKLYPHQLEGLRWLWSLNCMGTGGILGDDMGLGKTMQVSAFLAGLFHSSLIRRVLVVAPKTLLTVWIKELSVVGLRHMISDYSGSNKNDARDFELRNAFKEGGILLTTYNIVRINYKKIRGDFYNDADDEEEGRFRQKYELPIIRGNDKTASNRAKHIGSNVRKKLIERMKPYFLRRKKSEVSLETGLTDNKWLRKKKNELIIWLQLTDLQVLKKICDHPQIVTERAAENILEGMDGMLNIQEMEMAEKMAMNLADMAHDDDDVVEVGPEVSCKLFFILALLRNLLEEGHYVLIFSQTRIMLNLIQEAILIEGYSFLRMDGNTEVSERERMVKDFQEGLGAQIFLLTTKVGGLGLTLTKAARVIVVDPDWNPSTDDQSVARVDRIGQTKDVIVYRLMTSGTVEEKIYKSQVLKGALFRAATEKNEQTRYFSQSVLVMIPLLVIACWISY
ncbi:hypothetical protein QYE76_009748 [Lolium multiflorum]|uniref:Helicase C-terminal domain-containing protein n=1 Tax=Lolium multiflorum TaxID=4521 RepID=A0AAD8TSG7_LOLMU|nr:hypothetical protein QYE76_009748 [Lolium multiflorum]